MPTCGNCRQDVAFYEHGGLYYCNECDTQSQVMRVIEKDDEFDAVLNYSQSYSTTKKRIPKDTRRRDKDRAPARLWWSCELYQAILKAQVNTLLDMGFPAKLDEIVMQLWFRFLAKSGVAFCTTSEDDENTHLLNDDTEEHDGGGSKVKFHSKDNWLHRKEKGDSAGQSQPKKYCINLGKWDSVCFMYAGLRLMDEPVLLSDLVRWVRQGHLPLRSTSEVLPEHIAKTLNVLDFNRFCKATMNIQDVNTVFGVFHGLLAKLDLTLPPMSHGDIAFTIVRMIFSLNLPVELCSYTHRLHHKIQPVWDEKPERSKPIVPECHALAYIIVALKLLFSLNDHLEHTISTQTRKLQSLFPTGVNLFNWDVWVEAQKLRAQQCTNREGSAQSFSDLMKVHDMQNFVHYFNRFFQVEQAYKYLSVNKSGCQERLKEYQRPFRSLARDSSPVDRPKPSSLAMAVPQMQPTCGHSSHHDSTHGEGSHEQHHTNASADWKSRDYLLNEDFSRHTLKHLTNLKDLFEEYIIPPESVRSVCDLSESIPVDEQPLNRKYSVKKMDYAKTAFPVTQRSDVRSKPIKRKHKSQKETYCFSKGLRLKDQDVPYCTYPMLSTTAPCMKNQMDSFHASMEWLLNWCAEILEMNSKSHLVILVYNIEKTLFKK